MKCQNAQTSPAPEPEFLNTKQLLDKLPISQRTAYAMRDSGRLPFVRLERKVLYHWPSVRDALLRTASNSR